MTVDQALATFADAIAGGAAVGAFFVVISLFYGRRRTD
jgi:hypothetical protein